MNTVHDLKPKYKVINNGTMMSLVIFNGIAHIVKHNKIEYSSTEQNQ